MAAEKWGSKCQMLRRDLDALWFIRNSFVSKIMKFNIQAS